MLSNFVRSALSEPPRSPSGRASVACPLRCPRAAALPAGPRPRARRRRASVSYKKGHTHGDAPPPNSEGVGSHSPERTCTAGARAPISARATSRPRSACTHPGIMLVCVWATHRNLAQIRRLRPVRRVEYHSRPLVPRPPTRPLRMRTLLPTAPAAAAPHSGSSHRALSPLGRPPITTPRAAPRARASPGTPRRTHAGRAHSALRAPRTLAALARRPVLPAPAARTGAKPHWRMVRSRSSCTLDWRKPP